MEIIEYDEQKCIEAKNILGANLVYQKEFSHSTVIGNCVNLFRKLKPSNKENFYLKYLLYASINPECTVWQRGLSYSELIELSNKYKARYEQETNKVYDFWVYYYDLVGHIITETYDGLENERMFRKYLENNGCTCSGFDPNIDTKYGVDVKVTYDGTSFALQIKPISFFISKKESVKLDRIGLCRKYEEFMDKYKMNTYYAIYDKRNDSIKWLKNKKTGKFLFNITDLFEYDKEDIENTFVEKMTQLKRGQYHLVS